MNRGFSFPRAASWLLVLWIVQNAFPALAQPAAGNLEGRVTTLDGQPVAEAEVRVVELNRRRNVEPDGSFRFDGIPAGSYLVEAVSRSLGSAVDRITVTAGATAELTLALDLTTHSDEILVTASPDVRSRYEVAQPTSVMTREELQERVQPTLGETLSHEPGVTSTFFGQGASRPVIRGLGGDRIRVLDSGVGAGDASTTSPDHAVSIDPLSAERIEVLRGPATLLYGSSAVGGVVNVIDNRIPDEVPGEAFGGTFELRGGSVADERGGFGQLEGGLGRFAWHVDFLKRETDDYEIPGFAESEAIREGEEGGEEEEEAFGFVPNSATESESAAAGLSYVGDNGFLGVSVSGLDTLYGIPGGAHGHEGEEGEGGEEEEAAVRIDLEQRRYDLRGSVTHPFGFLRGANLRFGVTDYEHQELEGEEVGTLFLNDSWEGRIELLQKPVGALTGSFGLQALNRDFEAIGEEAFVPPTQTDSWAVFAFEELERGPWRFQLGARYENQDVTADADIEGPRDRSLSGLSGSLGLVYRAGENYSLGVSLARSTKLPNAEELFSNGPHIATRAFEIGDPNLNEETSLGLDVTLRKSNGPLTGELTFFTNRFNDYIFEQATGEEEDGLQVFQYVQRDTEFYGAELSGVWELFHGEPDHLDLEFGADFVRAELRDTGEALPRIPPRRYRLGFHYRGDQVSGRVEGVRTEEQDRVGRFETSTEGYTLLNASVGYRFLTDVAIFDVLLRGTNLTDEEARSHVSFLKDFAPFPGRDVNLSLRVTF